MRLTSRNWDFDQMAKLSGRLPLARVGGGSCPQCEKDVETRYIFGKFALCQRCAGHRLRLAAEVASFDAQATTAQLHQAIKEVGKDGAD